MKTPNRKRINNSKINDLAKNKEKGQDQFLTTNQGLRINDDQNSLKAGERGATLLEDFQLREKILILIMKEFRSELFMQEEVLHTDILNCINL